MMLRIIRTSRLVVVNLVVVARVLVHLVLVNLMLVNRDVVGLAADGIVHGLFVRTGSGATVFAQRHRNRAEAPQR